MVQFCLALSMTAVMAGRSGRKPWAQRQNICTLFLNRWETIGKTFRFNGLGFPICKMKGMG